jgi:hypothetical protein
MELIDYARDFSDAKLLDDKWNAARMMMNVKGKIDSEQLFSLIADGFQQLGQIAAEGDDVRRLVATDLLVRLPQSFRNNKRIQALAQEARHQLLLRPLPPLSTVSDKKGLPQGAEPAEVRENVAIALHDASSDWVLSYLFRGLAEEERSQRCRLALASEIAARLPSVDQWLEALVREPSLFQLAERSGTEQSTGRIKDICGALIQAIRDSRASLSVSPKSGALLAELMRAALPTRARTLLPRRLDTTAEATVEFLNEMLSIRLTIMDEPALYEPVSVIFRWWSPLPFPAKVSAALNPIVDKLLAGIVFRARGSQRSELLLQRLKEAFNNRQTFDQRITQLLSEEPGLSSEIQDWLRGIHRNNSAEGASSALASVNTESFLRELAELLRASFDVSDVRSGAHLAEMVRALGLQYGLSTVGTMGQRVEYSPNLYELPTGEKPSERTVVIVRPAIVRRRRDGGTDVMQRGIVRNT